MLALLVPGTSSAQVSPVIRLGLVVADPVVFMGCLEYRSSRATTCIVARNTAGGVNVLLVEDPDVETLGDSYAEEATSPGATLALFTEPGRLKPSVRLNAELPRTGAIDLVSRATFFTDGVGYENISAPIARYYNIDLVDARGLNTGLPVSGGDTIGGRAKESGSIGGRTVSAARSDSMYSTVQAVARWRFLFT